MEKIERYFPGKANSRFGHISQDNLAFGFEYEIQHGLFTDIRKSSCFAYMSALLYVLSRFLLWFVISVAAQMFLKIDLPWESIYALCQDYATISPFGVKQ